MARRWEEGGWEVFASDAACWNRRLTFEPIYRYARGRGSEDVAKTVTARQRRGKAERRPRVDDAPFRSAVAEDVAKTVTARQERQKKPKTVGFGQGFIAAGGLEPSTSGL